MSAEATGRRDGRARAATVAVGCFATVGALFWPFLRPALRRVAPYMPAGSALVANVADAVGRYAPAQASARRVMVDLGSGDGVVVLECARRLAPDWGSFVGVENNLWLVLASRVRAWRMGVRERVAFVTADLYRHDLARYDVTFVCLVPSMLPSVEERLVASAVPHSLVLSARFPLPTWIPEHVYAGDAVSGLWVYRVPEKQ